MLSLCGGQSFIYLYSHQISSWNENDIDEGGVEGDACGEVKFAVRVFAWAFSAPGVFKGAVEIEGEDFMYFFGIVSGVGDIDGGWVNGDIFRCIKDWGADSSDKTVSEGKQFNIMVSEVNDPDGVAWDGDAWGGVEERVDGGIEVIFEVEVKGWAWGGQLEPIISCLSSKTNGA